MFSAVEGGSGDNGHKRWVTRSGGSVIGTGTDADDVRNDTGATLEETETGTRDETEDATSQEPDGVLIGCEGAAPTCPGRELTRVEGSIPPGLRGVTPT